MAVHVPAVNETGVSNTVLVPPLHVRGALSIAGLHRLSI